MRKMMLAGAALLALAFAGCSDDGDGGLNGAGPDATPPAAVPPGAEPVREETVLGALSGEGEERRFVGSACADDVLVITTDREAVYAELPCDRALPADVTGPFAGREVELRITTGEPRKVFLRIESGESAEFTVGGVWTVAVE